MRFLFSWGFNDLFRAYGCRTRVEVKRVIDVIRFAGKLVHEIADSCDCIEAVHSIGISVGISIFPDDGGTIESLLKKADTAMFEAKGTENRVALFGELPRDLSGNLDAER